MWRTCKTCGVRFRVFPSHSYRKYCSRACQVKDKEWCKNISEAKKHKERITKICPTCGKKFEVPSSQERVIYCSRECCRRNDQWHKNLSEANKGRKSMTSEQYKRIATARTKHKWTYEELYRLYWEEEKPEAQIAEELGALVSMIHYHLVRLGIPRRNRLASSRRNPNGSERALIKFMKVHNLPYKYTGSGQLIIGGRVPDFTHNIKRKVIELFGAYWHTLSLNSNIKPNRTSIETIKHYEKYSYECLVIWESELKDKKLLLHNILEFSEK